MAPPSNKDMTKAVRLVRCAKYNARLPGPQTACSRAARRCSMPAALPGRPTTRWRGCTVQLLSTDGYAESVEGESECAWVLLGKPPPDAVGVQVPAARQLALPAPATPAGAIVVTAGRANKGKGKAPTPAAAAGSSSSAAARAAAPPPPPPSAGGGPSRAAPRPRGKKQPHETVAVVPPELWAPKAAAVPDIVGRV